MILCKECLFSKYKKFRSLVVLSPLPIIVGIINVFGMFLVLEVPRTSPAKTEEGDVDPEGVVKVGVNSVLNVFNDRTLTWIATKDVGPSAHENVRSNSRSAYVHHEVWPLKSCSGTSKRKED